MDLNSTLGALKSWWFIVSGPCFALVFGCIWALGHTCGYSVTVLSLPCGPACSHQPPLLGFPYVSLMAGIGVLWTSNYSEILVGGEQHIDNLGLNISFVLKTSPRVHHFYFLNFMLWLLSKKDSMANVGREWLYSGEIWQVIKVNINSQTSPNLITPF